MAADPPALADWRDAAAYAPLLAADRSLFAWEWLRRNQCYRDAAVRAGRDSAAPGRVVPDAAAFGLAAFEDPELAVPAARPLWLASVHSSVLSVVPAAASSARDRFDLVQFSTIARVVAGPSSAHLLLSDGFRAIRLDGARGAFSGGGLRFIIEGLASAEAKLLAMRRFVALARTGRFARTLHPPETRAPRWILMLRVHDALAAGASQREIAGALLSPSATLPLWRDSDPSLRLRVQRLVRSAHWSAGHGYRKLL